VANQFTTRLTEEIRDAVFGNMGTIVSFRVGQNDVDALAKYFQPIFDGDDLLRVPNYNTIVRTLIGGVPTQPFSMATLPSLGTPNPRLSEALKQLSAAKYGKPRAMIDKEINERLATKPSRPASRATAPSGNSNALAPSSGRPAAPRPTGTGNFLDEWLDKRQTVVPATSGAPIPVSASPPVQPASTPPAQPTVAPTPHQPVMAPAGPPPSFSSTTAPAASPMSVPAPMPDPSIKPVGASPNISSDELENQQVHKIASELKQELQASKKEPVTVKKTEHVADLRPGKDDTIFIDRDGSFRHTSTT
jgi:hypothetical protein